MQIAVRNLTKTFGKTAVLKSVSLTIESHELFFLLGPSGCGKTTLLRSIAGFYEPDGGEILFDGKVVNRVPPHERNTGMVFQNYALWPHMSVSQNVSYGLEVRKTPREETKKRTQEALAIVRMEKFAERMPNQLSGGQQQRVALARALAIRPDVLLLDEPLSNLDARLRLEMRDEIRRIHEATRITTVYVTHDQKESLSLADRIAVMKEGVVEQLSDPRTIYRQPANRFVADFVGETNWLEGVVESVGTETIVRSPAGQVRATGAHALKPGDSAWIGFRPEATRLDGQLANVFDAELVQTNYLGDLEEYLMNVGGTILKAFEQNPEQRLPRGTKLKVGVAARDILLLPRG